MYRYPFGILSGATSGISNSSYALLGDLSRGRTLGQAKLSLFTNIATGNVTLQGFRKNLRAPGFNLSAGMTYNSNKGWRFSLGKSLTVKGQKSSIEVEQPDGAVITFNYDSESGNYIAKSIPGGNQTITVEGDGSFKLTHAETGLTEEFNKDGLQTKAIDSSGNILNFYYQNGKLVEVASSSGQKVLLAREEKKLTVNFVETGKSYQVMSYDLDEKGRVTTTNVPLLNGSYQINYSYNSTSGLLEQVTQTDGTRCELDSRVIN